MSLVVWLPMTKDLRQQGLSNRNITNTGATFSSNGKLGGCYLFDGTDDAIGIGDLNNICPDGNFSFACWFYKSEFSSKGYDTIFGGPSGFELETKNGTTNSNVIVPWNWGKPQIAYEFDKWYHLVMTRTSSGTTYYLNGEQVATGTAGTIPAGNYFIGAWNTATQQNYKGKLNDVRIYDHCLSPMEVKRISQGLVLHYPLNRMGFGQDNLMVNTHFDLRYIQSTGWNTTKNGTLLASSWGGYNGGVTNASSVYHAHLKEVNGEYVYEYIKTSNESWLGIAQWNFESKLIAGETYTFSWEEYHVEGTNRVGTGLYYYKTGATSANFHLGIQQASNVTRVLGQWQKFSYTFVAPTDADWSKSMGWYIYGHYNGNGTFYMRHPKLEKGSIATPWAPNSTDSLYTAMGLNSLIEYDTSGYCNNGTRTGTFTWTSDTPKYSVSTKITPNSNIQFTPMLAGATSWTIAAWIKPTVANNDGRAWFSVEQDTYWQVTCYSNSVGIRDNSIGGTGTRKNYSFGTITASVWTHLVATYDNGVLKLYKDGVLVSTNTVGGTYLNAMNNGRWGSAVQDGYYWNGQISDGRIYATALSATDVKSLYQNTATIDADGTIHGAVR